MKTVTGNAGAVARCSSVLLGFRMDTGRGAVIVTMLPLSYKLEAPLSPIYEVSSPQQDVQTPVVSLF